MTAEQFIKKYVGKKVDADGAYGYQCVDLVKKYFPEVLGTPAIRNNAVDYWTNYPTKYLTRITNTASFLPKRGDIMVWGTKVGKYGHIAIVDTANLNTFVSLDQNWPYSNGTTPAKKITHNYSGVLGVLRPKKDVNFDQVAYDKAIAAKKAAEAAAKAAADAVAKKKAEEAAAKAKAEAEILAREQTEANKKAAEAAKLEAEKQKKIAEEQVRLEKEIQDKLAIEQKLKEEKEKLMQAEKGSLNKDEVLASLRGGLYTFLGVVGAQMILIAGQVHDGRIDLKTAGLVLAATALSILGNMVKKFFEGV